MDASHRVKDANKVVYNKLGNRYEIIDGRRSLNLYRWIRHNLNEISQMAGGRDSLLDIGCGTGFVAKAATGIFSKLYGIDISENILKNTFLYGILPVCADAEKLPYRDECMDVIVLFSVMHHFYDFRPVLNEVYRVLKPGGVVYIDHDMNKCFFKNFRILINTYRRLSHKERIFKTMGIENLYSISEFHSEGIDSEGLKDYLVYLGFEIKNIYYHWYGVSELTNFIFRERRLSKEIAPLGVFIVQKQQVKKVRF